MTRGWVSQLHPAPAEQLAAAMRSALPDSATPNSDELLQAAELLLDNVMRTDCETRGSAIDLLAVDALVTHALHVASSDESAADYPGRILARIASWKY